MIVVNGVTPMLFMAPDLGEAELVVLAQIADLRKNLRWQLYEPRRWMGSLRRLSFARAIQGSNTIEGYTAALDDAAAVAAGEEPLDASAETRLALAGYRDAMTYVLQLAGEPDFVYTEQLLKSLHFMMTSYDLKKSPGLWRPGSIYVHKDDTGEVVYEGAPVDHVPELMHQLVEDLNEQGGTPPMVRAGMAHLNLVMVHPFRDGNGRMARCLQSLVLAREGVDPSPVFLSIEEYLGRNTQAYYDVLAQVGGGRWQPERDARPWIRFVLTAHVRQARTLLRRVKESERLWEELEKVVTRAGLPDRTLYVLFDAAIGLRVRNGTYRASIEGLEEISEQTATRDLGRMVDQGLLAPHGAKRGRHYVRGETLRNIWQSIVQQRDPRDESDPFASAA
jgi:Fic family protein